METNTYTNRSNAARAARAALGADRISGVHFRVTGDGPFAWEPIAQDPAPAIAAVHSGPANHFVLNEAGQKAVAAARATVRYVDDLSTSSGTAASVDATSRARKARNPKAEADKAPKAAKPAQALESAPQADGGVKVLPSPRNPRTDDAQVAKFSARWKQPGGGGNTPWTTDRAKAEAKVQAQLAAGFDAWMVEGYFAA